MDKVADPAAGSYYVESITDAMAFHAWDLFKKIEAEGGFKVAIENGSLQDMVIASGKERAKDIATRKLFVLGTNQFPNLNEKMEDKVKLTSCECRPISGQEKIKVLRPFRGTQALDSLRLETEKHIKSGNKQPKVFLLTYGNLAMRKARAGFATNFFGCAGYEIIDNAGFKSGEEGAEAALAAKADVVVLCSSDDEYPELVNAATPLLKGKVHLVLAGYPKEQMETFKTQGIEEFIHVKSNLLDILTAFQQKLLK